MRNTIVFGLLAAASAAALAGAVHAADLGPIEPLPAADAVPDAQYEFGTGWYLRGDAATGPEDAPALTATGFTTTKQDWNYVLGGGVGYKFNSFLRADVTGDYFQPRDYAIAAGTVNGETVYNKASIQHYAGLANLYIDLGSWYGFTPYVGGGAGVAIFDPSEHLAVANGGLDNTSNRTKFAWAAMAGVSYQFDQNVAVDLGYRHLDLGRFTTTLVGYAIDHRYTEDEVRIGVRYMID